MVSAAMATALSIVASWLTMSAGDHQEVSGAILWWCFSMLFALHSIVQLTVGNEAWFDERSGKAVLRRSWPGRRPPREHAWSAACAFHPAAVVMPSFTGNRVIMGLALVVDDRTLLLAAMDSESAMDHFVENLPGTIKAVISNEVIVVRVRDIRLL